MKLTNVTGVFVSTDEYNDLREGATELWSVLKAHSKLCSALRRIRDDSACNPRMIAYEVLQQDLRDLDLSNTTWGLSLRKARGESVEPTCEHGVAWDVHCCNCHSGFIFDKTHECPDPAAQEGPQR